MDARDPPELGTALLRWINSFGLADTIDSWKQLQDGEILWKILQNVEPSYFSGDLPEDISNSSNWIPRWQNLKYINRMVVSFIRDECGKLLELSKRMNPDLKAMAIDASASDSIQLVKTIFLAAMYSPESNQRMILVIDKLGTKVGIALASSISQMEQLDHRLSESAPTPDVESDIDRTSSPEPQSESAADPATSAYLKRDPDLEREEQLIEAYSQIQKLERGKESLTEDLDKLRQEKEGIQNELSQVRYRLEHGHMETDEESALELLKQKATHDKETIEQLEGELGDARSHIESQEKQVERLQRESESYQKLRDEIQMLKIERDELQQKSKANENLKKKIQTLQDSDKSNQKTREDLAAAEQELQVLRPLRSRITALQKANDESMKLIQNGEQEIFDQKTTRKRLDHELKMLRGQLETAKEKHQSDQETIRETEEKLRELRGSETENGEPVSSLDEEFTSRDKAFNDLKSKNNELQAEVTKLRQMRSEEEPTSSAPDQTAYDNLKERCDKLEKQYLEVYQENLGLTSAAQDAQEHYQQSQPFVEIRERLKAESEQKATLEKRLFDLEAELSKNKVELQSVSSKLSAVDKDQAEALEELQQSASTENSILHKENTRLLEHIRKYESDLEEHRSLLRHALLDKNSLVAQEKNQRFQDELKLITEHFRAVVDKPDRLEDMALRLAERIEEARQQTNDMEAERAKQAQAHQDDMEQFKARAKKAEEAAAKHAKNPGQENLQRELNLMTSAWYDVTRRMQSDAVAVQRRSEAPQSFLNRQRKLMNRPTLTRQ